MENSNIDKYTGLPSRAYAFAVLEDLINHADEGEQISVIFIDIDFFKRFNDRHGHNTGDKMLWGLARMMENAVGRECTIARYGGDEFLIVAQETELFCALQKAEILCQRAAAVTIENNGQQLGPLTLTLGVGCFPKDGATASKLIEAADEATYAGKLRGGNCAVAARDVKASESFRRDTPKL